MREITLKTANYPTTVSRAKVRKAVKEADSVMSENKTSKLTIPEVNVLVTNRVPAKTKK